MKSLLVSVVGVLSGIAGRPWLFPPLCSPSRVELWRSTVLRSKAFFVGLPPTNPGRSARCQVTHTIVRLVSPQNSISPSPLVFERTFSQYYPKLYILDYHFFQLIFSTESPLGPRPPPAVFYVNNFLPIPPPDHRFSFSIFRNQPG